MDKKSKGGDGPGRRRGRGRGRGRELGSPAEPPSAASEPESLIGAMASLSTGETESTTPKPPKQDVAGSEETLEITATLCKRPGQGVKGRAIRLCANFYPVKLDKDIKVQHYDVNVFRKKPKVSRGFTDPTRPELTPVARLPRFLAVALFEKMYESYKEVFRNPYRLAFDGQKNLFSRDRFEEIGKDGRDFPVTIINTEKSINEEFIIKIKWAAEVVVDIRQVFDRNLMARKSVATLILDVVLRQPYFYKLDYYIPLQRRIFYYPSQVDMNSNFLSPGVYRYPGFWQSLRPVSGWKAMLNIDQANTAFVKPGNVLDILLDFEYHFETGPLDPRTMRSMKYDLEKIVKGLKVTQTQRKLQRTSKCLKVMDASANDLKFTIDEDGKKKTVSVAEYFTQQFKKREFAERIKYPHLPCLHLGSPNKQTYVPLEFCKIKEGQRYPRKLDGQQTSNMLGLASQKPDIRKRAIEEDMKYLKLQQNEYLKSFGIDVTQDMVQFSGRVLNPPTIKFSNKSEMPEQGRWRQQRVITGCKIRQFGVITTADERRCSIDQLRNFFRELQRVAQNIGITMNRAEPAFIYYETNPENMKARLQEARAKVGPELDLVIVVLPGQNTDFYPKVKQAGDVAEGVNTQCIQLTNVLKAERSTLTNLWLKINGKLGGINSHLTDNAKGLVAHFLDEPILFLGADVNHPAPNEYDDPVSCAAIVGNIDAHPSMYCARIFLQAQKSVSTADGRQTTRPQEWISEMKVGVKMAIEHFLDRNRVLPRRIIMYRDGVGETMFLLVLNKELKAIREACTEISERYPQAVIHSGFKSKRYEPPITFIVVQKRHHTRLFCVDQRDATRSGNVPPGTTVDVEIGHPEEFDFYLCSHLGIQGTSKPAHYHVLWDDSNFSADDLQTLTYFLCHTYCRATLSVSIPPPCYYADLVAYRARQYLTSRHTDTASTRSSGSGAQQHTPITELQRFVNVQDSIVRKGMYYV